jgi:hypothetical protein
LDVAGVRRRLEQLWRLLRPAVAHFNTVSYVDSRSVMPSTLLMTDFIVVGSVRQPKWAIFDCPCGAGHRIEVPLDGKGSGWKLSRSRGRPTLAPSIHVRGGSGCHFVVDQGTIRWVRDAFEGHTTQRSPRLGGESRFRD